MPQCSFNALAQKHLSESVVFNFEPLAIGAVWRKHKGRIAVKTGYPWKLPTKYLELESKIRLLPGDCPNCVSWRELIMKLY